MDTPTVRVEYRWIRDGHSHNAGGTTVADLEQARAIAGGWVLDGIRAGVGSAHRGPLPATPALGRRQAVITETRVVETVGPKVLDLGPVHPDILAAITGDPDGPRVAPIADRPAGAWHAGQRVAFEDMTGEQQTSHLIEDHGESAERALDYPHLEHRVGRHDGMHLGRPQHFHAQPEP